jgi:hypothetical protein|tara:strand:- start:240 stop:536 length:297 start_codon:yes stop_codon:yes gene_type:complete
MGKQKRLTTNRMREILTEFIDNCECETVRNFGFDESFWETTSECEETWEDDDSIRMKTSLIDNYLLQFGYHVIEEDANELSKKELIDNYIKNLVKVNK